LSPNIPGEGCSFVSHYEKFADGTVKCIEDEIPFEIPDSWVWCRFKLLFYTLTGLSYKKEFLQEKSSKYIRVLRGGNIENGKWLIKDDDVMIGMQFVKSDQLLRKNTFITPAVTSLEQMGKTAFVTADLENIVVGGFVLRIIPYSTQNNMLKYLLYFFQTVFYKTYCQSITNKSGQAFYNLSRSKLMECFIPIPPLTEQQRIVAKLEEVLPIVEKYGKSQDDIDLLNNELKARLQKSVLQEAIQGKLVEQDPTDEPAARLLERIHTEKQELVKQGKLKKSELNDSVIFKGEDNKYYEQIGNVTKDISEEIPFEIPENWVWCRMKNCCLKIFSGKSPSYSKSPTKCIIIGQQANQWNNIDLKFVKYGTDKYAESVNDFEYLQEGDVLLNSLGNGTLGRCGIFNNIKERILTDGHLFVFRTNNNATAKFILFFLKCNYWKINESADGSTNQTFLSLKTVSNYLVPIPPLEEQIRIVNKYELLLQKLM